MNGRSVFFIVVFGAAVAAILFFRSPQHGAFVRGQPAPEIVGADIDGLPMKLSDFRGQAVLLDFWGNW